MLTKGLKVNAHTIPITEIKEPNAKASLGSSTLAGSGRLMVLGILASISRSTYILSTVLPLMDRNRLPKRDNIVTQSVTRCPVDAYPAQPVISSKKVCLLFVSSQYAFSLMIILSFKLCSLTACWTLPTCFSSNLTIFTS